MPKTRLNVFFLLSVFSCLAANVALAETFYCEADVADSMPPVSLRLSTFTDGTTSAVLQDGSNWTGTASNSTLDSTGVFYRFSLKLRVESERDSSLKLFLSRFSLKLYGRREDRNKGKLLSVSEYSHLQCFQEVIQIFPERP